jgi:enoyl-CoA hydratase/carnithine racemase
MDNSNDEVILERRGAVQWITINRPERRNALNDGVFEGIAAGLRAAAEAPDVRAVVLTGAGDKAFCAGADLKKDDENRPFPFDPAQPKHRLIRLFEQFESCNAPIIARVNGHVLAGGMGLLCACDMAVAVETALVGTPEVKVGVFPMMIMAYVQRIVPRRKLLEMVLTGEPWSAGEARELGLFNYVVPGEELDDKVDWLLGRLLDKSPTAIRLGKDAFHAIQDMALPQALAYSQNKLPLMTLTEDAQEGIRAFNEKRAPNWSGK